MTPESVMKLTSGPLLDLQVHVHVFDESPADKKLPAYSSDPDTEPIKKKMKSKGFHFQVPGGAGFQVGFTHPGIPLDRCIFESIATADEVPIVTKNPPAICRTAVASILRLAEIEKPG